MWKQVLSRRMGAVFLMGFASGLPLLLVGGTLQAWMTEAGVDLGTIGVFALVGVPYSLKVLWAPLLDRYVIWPGRRRGWMWPMQLLLVAAIYGLSYLDPAQDLALIAVTALLITVFSATQDIAIDAYRREMLPDEQLGIGSSLYTVGYRIAMLVAGSLSLWLADVMLVDGKANWPLVYRIMAGFMAWGVLITARAPKEDGSIAPPRSLQEAVVGPFKDFFSRDGALLIMLFIVLYKAGDTMAAHMTTPFMIKHGYSKSEIAGVVKTFGLLSIIVGGLLGGIGTFKLGINRAMWLFGILQGVSTLGFCWLASTAPQLSVLATVIAFENLSAGLGTSAYMAFMASLTNRRFTGTQYALLTGLMSLPRTVLAVPTGWMAESLGWPGFFAVCALIAVPGMALIPLLTRRLGAGTRSEDAS
jgi:PAT family beta-lactamase induction signal transducer AmpG